MKKKMIRKCRKIIDGEWMKDENKLKMIFKKSSDE